ncbi:MAG: MmcQ/YjbR family DNA-binding protein [Arachnia sp.]
MAHPAQFDPDDPLLARVRTIALALPGASEKLVVGHAAWCTRKVFAYYGMSYKVDGEWVRNPPSLAVLLSEDERLALLDDERTFIPGYIGPFGWIGLHLGDDTDWQEMAELVEESFRQTAAKRLIAELDTRT